MVYQLWSTDTNNLVASLDNEHAALALVLQGIRRNGIHTTDTLSLDAEDEDGNVHPIAHGQALAERVYRELAGNRRIAV